MLYKLKYYTTVLLPMNEDAFVIIFTDMDEKRAVSFTADRYVANEIKAHMNNAPGIEECALTVVSKLWKGSDPDTYEIEIDADRKQGFKMRLVDKVNNESHVMRPDQAVLLGLVNGLDFMATHEVFQYFSTPFDGIAKCVSLPIIGMSIPMLKEGLKQAVADENYETASLIRDEMKRRNELGI